MKKSVLKNFAIFTGKPLSLSFFLIKLPSGLKRYLKEHRCFPVNIAKLLRTTILKCWLQLFY